MVCRLWRHLGLGHIVVAALVAASIMPALAAAMENLHIDIRRLGAPNAELYIDVGGTPWFYVAPEAVATSSTYIEMSLLYMMALVPLMIVVGALLRGSLLDVKMWAMVLAGIIASVLVFVAARAILLG